MKHTMKRALALLIAVLLAMPSFAFAEEPMVNQAYPEETVSQPAPATEGDDLGADLVDPDEIVLDDVDQPVEEGGDADFAGSEELPEETAGDAFVADAPEEAAPVEEEIADDGETFGAAEEAGLKVVSGQAYTVIFDNGLEGDDHQTATQTLIYGNNTYLALLPDSFSRPGYTFDCWKDVDGYTYANGGYFTNPKQYESVVLFAQWTPVLYTVQFKGNGATSSGEMADEPFYYGESKALTANTYERTGYTFAGWATAADATVPEFYDGQSLTIQTEQPTVITLYAVWEVGDYIVHFDPNGGEGPERDQAFTVDEVKALRDNTYTREGYTFKEWNTAADGTGTAYQDGKTVTNLASAGQEITLYAHWIPNVYTVKFDGNGAEAGTMADKTMYYDDDDTLTSNGFTRTGYEFIGWSMDPDATLASYTDVQNVINLTSSGEVTLYAVWKAKEYRMTFHWVLNNFSKDEVITQEYGTPVTPPTMDYPGYTFMGWRGAAAESAAIVDVPATMPALNYQFWSDWRPNVYNVWFDPGEGEGRAQYQTFIYDVMGSTDETKLKSIAQLGFTKKGYVFDHWVQSGTGATFVDEQQPVYNLTTEDDGRIDFTAVWKPIEYTVQFNNAGTTSTAMPTQLFTYDEEQALRKNTYAPEGQHFLGWSDVDGGAVKYADEEVVKNLTDTATTVDLYGVYGKNDYTVTFNANGGEGTMEDQPFTYGENQNLYKNRFTRTGYTFLGWSRNIDATVKSYDDEQAVANFTTEKGAVVTLYAVWSANTYVVKYDSNSTSLTTGSAVPDQVFTYDVSEKLNAVTFDRPGFTFSHWNTKPMGNGDSYEDGALVKNLTTEGVVTLYAIWRPIQYSVYFEANGGTGTMEPQTFAFNEVKPIRALGFEREGYTFENWYVVDHTNPNPVSPSYLNDGQNVTKALAAIDGATVTATAIWKPITYTVKYLANDELAIGEVEGSVDNQTYTYDSAPTNLNANGFTLKGYTFTGWNTQADGKGQHFEAGAAINFADTFHGDGTLYAIWKLNEYQINYNLNDSPSVPAKLTGAPTSYNVSNEPFELVNPTRPGFVFLGWTGGNTIFNLTNPQVDVVVPKGTVSTLNFTANWQEVVMTVQYRANSDFATGTMTDDDVAFTAIGLNKIKANKFEYKPYYFAGWTLDPDADPVTVDYGDEDRLAKIYNDYLEAHGAPEGNFVVTLYAVWSTENHFVINYIPNIPDMSDETNAVNQDAYKGTYTRLLKSGDDALTAVGNKFTRTGYTLLGWHTDPAAVEPLYAPGEKVMFTENKPVTLYGVWGENKYNVSFLDADGKVLNIEKMAFGVTPEFEAPEKAPDGQNTYVFAGWKCAAYKAAEVSTTTYDDTVNPTVALNAVYNGTLPAVSGETAYQATYDAVPRTFSVTWLDHNDTVIKVKTPYLYGDHPTSDLTVGTAGDDGDIPDYEDDFYTYHWNGSWADVYNVVYKTEAELPVVTEDAVYFAVYEKTPKQFPIVLLNDDETTRLEGTNQYAYDSTVTPPKPTSTYAATDEAHTYNFKGWVNIQDETETVHFNLPKVTGDATYKAVYEVLPNIYQIDFVSDLGNYVLQTLYVPYGEIPEYTGTIPVELMDPEVTVEGTDYVFDGWLDEDGKAYPDELPVVTAKATYKAHFAAYAETFTVTWKDHAGVVVENDVDVAYGAKPEFSADAKMVDYDAEDGSYHYEWAGWFSEADPDTIYTAGVDQLPPVTEDVIYDAYYTATPNDFTIRFVNYDNSAWSTKEYPYGTKANDIVLPVDPERPQEDDTVYTFVGWEPEIADVTGNATYRAVFEASDRLYKVIWTDDMGNVLETEKDYLFEDVPSYPNGVPEMAAQPADHKVYTFAGWEPSILPIPGNAATDGVITYKATFRESDEKMIVVFKDYEGNTMDIQTVDYNGAAAEPTAPADYETEEATYSFKEWVPDIKGVTISNITCDVTFTAKMEATPKQYPIILLNDDNQPLSTNSYDYGTFPVPPTPTSANVTADAHFDYDFIGWLDADGTLLDFLPAVTGPATYKAVYLPTAKAYKITFQNGNDKLQESEWLYGDLPEYTGILPTKAAENGTEYVFVGWTPAVTEVQGEATYDATFTNDVQTFTHTFYNFDGTKLWKVSGEYNSTYTLASDLLDAATKPEDDYYTYSFKEWQTSTPGAVVETITGNASFIAVYEATAKEYTITLLNDNGTEFKKIEQLHYGDQPVVGTELPTKAPEDGYTFVFDHWIDAEGNEYDILPVVTGNAAYKAVFEPTTKKFLIRFLDDDDTVLQSAEYDYGDIPVYAGVTPTKNNPEAGKEYAFVGWLPAVTEVTQKVDYKPVFTDNLQTFTHRFYNYDGTLLYEVEGEYGDTYQDPAPFVKPEKPESSTTTYTYANWVCLDTNATLGTIESNASFVATYTEVTRGYTITLLNDDGSTFYENGTYGYGDQPLYDPAPTKTDPNGKFEYTLEGWTGVDGTFYAILPSVTGDATYKAVFSKKLTSYIVTFQNEDGSVTLQTGKYLYGETPVFVGEAPTKESTNDEHYVFTGWTPAVVPVTGDAYYRATFTPETNYYVHSYYDYDGTLLHVFTGEFGTDYTEPAGPTREPDDEFTYEFTSWLPVVSGTSAGDMNGFASFVAQYEATPRTYTVTLINDDDTLVETIGGLAYGAQPVATQVPTKDDPTGKYTYTFDKWIDRDGESHVMLPNVTGDATYKATYISKLNSYRIRFVDEDGTVLQDNMEPYGSIPDYEGEEPTKPGAAGVEYVFERWTPAVTEVYGDRDYYATYTDETQVFTHEYFDYDGTLLYSISGEYGNTYAIPDGPTRESSDETTYTFKTWLPTMANAEKGTFNRNAAFVATYTEAPRGYTITLVYDNDTEVEKLTGLAYGEQPVPTVVPTKAPDEKYTYTFDKWVDRNGESHVILPVVSGDATYKATFTKQLNTFWVSFFNEDGSIKLQTSEYAYGEIPVYTGLEPIKVNPEDGKTYTFAGWTPAVVAVTGNADYKATFTDETDVYTHTYYDYDGTLLHVFTGEYGTDYTEPAGPNREPDDEFTYQFTGWLPVVSGTSAGDMNGFASFVAQYEATPRTYTVTLINDDDTLVETIGGLAYGAQPVATQVPTKDDPTGKYTYTFDKWIDRDGESHVMLPNVTGDATYKATYISKLNSYRIRFVDEDGTVLQDNMEPYGSIPDYEGEEPTKPGAAGVEYVFERWTPAVTEVYGDRDYYATYTDETQVFTHEYFDYDGTLLYSISGEYGNTYAIPDGPTRESSDETTYTFKTWLPTMANAEKGTFNRNAAFVATYTEAPRGYTITLVNDNDTEVEKLTGLAYGEQPVPTVVPTKAPDEKYTYTFDKWVDRNGESHVILPVVSGDATYKATFTKQLNTFWVSFFNEDGSIKLQTSEYAYGEIPVYTGLEPIKVNPEDGKTYTFAGWTPAVVAVTGNADYKATFTDETDVYVHTYYDYDGTLLHVFTGEFGTDYTEPAGPTREPDDEFTYEFDKWLPVVAGTNTGLIESNATFVAQYKHDDRTYTVTLVNDDDTLVETIGGLAYGAQPVPTQIPAKTDPTGKYTYTFDKWIDRDGKSYVILPNVTGDATYKATYTKQLNNYQIRFLDEEGTKILQDSMEPYGTVPVFKGEEPTKASENGKSFSFIGWTPAVTEVNGDRDYYATFVEETDTYTHLYYDFDGTLLYTFTGEYNTSYTAPVGPVRESDDESTYTFDKWLPLVSGAATGTMMGNASFIATYTSDERMYTITFLYDDGTPYYSIDLPYGAQPAVNAPIKADTLDTTYDFDHWTNEDGDVFTIVPMVTGNATYEASFLPSEREYLVAFMDEGADIETITEVDPANVPAGDLPKITIEANSNTVTIHSYRKDGKGTYTETTITGNLLQIDWLPYGATPTYKGLAPVKQIGAGDEGKTFVFERWTPAISTVIGDTIYVATYASEEDIYVHNFYNYDGELITGIRGKLNETYDDPANPVPPVRPSDGEKNYTFDHWQPDTAGVTVGTIEGNANFTAVYTDQASGYTITYLNDDGSFFDEENLDYGEQPMPGIPTKQDSDEFSYVFDHWIDAEGNTYEILPTVTGDAVYKAVFEAVTRKYDVIFYDEDGTTILQTSEYEYGEVPSYQGKEPTKPEEDGVTYTFAGWTPAIVEVHGPQMYKAVYTPETEIYTHGFYNYDGELLYEISGKYDTDYADPAATINPTRPADERYSYTFDHWQPTVSGVQVGKILGNATFIAVYLPEIADYMITFVNDDDTLIEQQPYEYGDQPIAPKAVKSDTFEHTYRFLHWVDRDGTAWTILPKVTGDATYKAVYEEQDRVYLVAFMGEDATIVTETAMQPSAASNDMQARVEADMGSATIYTIRDDGTGTFTESTFTGTLLQYQWMPFGSIPEYMGNDPVPVNPDDGYTYTFTGWTPVLSPVSGDIVYVATFDKQLTEYTITWVDGDGYTLEETYYYGETPTYKGPIPTKTSSDSEVYTFTGWAPDIEAVWRDRTYVAQFDAEPRLYTVTFVDENGFDLEDTPKQYPYGTPAGSIELPTNIPTKMADATGTYTFAGWTPLITTVTGDAVYKATYRRTEQTYLIAFMNDDAVYNIKKTVIPVDSAVTPETRIETDLHDVTTVTTYRNDGNGTLYETTYVGTLLQVDWMKYGVMPKYTGIDPVSTDVTGKYTSEFVGWTPAIVPVYGDAVYVAAYNRTENTYNVTWLDGDHNELYTENVPYGTHPVYNGPEPTKTPIGGYTYEFTGNWTPEITDQTIVTNRDMTFTAVFDSVRRKYSIKFVDEDGTTVLKEAEQYYYGTPAKDIIKPDDPTKEPDGVFTYKFTGWEPLVADVTCDMVYRATYNNNFRKYTITWIVDGVVSTEEVPYGVIPTYQMGATPKKATDDYYDYFFIGWDRMIVPVTKDATYEAQFAKFPRLYTIVWDTGDVVTSEKHGYGTLIKWPENPTRPGYEFVGWDPEVPNYMPAWDLRFTAVWREVDNYLVRFVNWDDSLLQASLMKYLEIPVFKGGTPTRPDDEFYTYTFIGWTPIISEILGETTFKAQYQATLRPEFLPDDDDQGGVLASGLIAVMKAAGSKKLKINWTRVNGVSGYDIYFNRCNSDGEIRYVKLIATVPAGRNTYTVTGLTKQICYKTVVRAFRIIDGKKVYVAKSPMAHAICGGSNRRYTNPKSLKVKPKNVTLNLVGHKKIKPTLKGLRDSKIVLDQGHAPRVRYYTSNPAVAVVNGKGVISAVGRGNCKVYALAANGIYKIINVRVR